MGLFADLIKGKKKESADPKAKPAKEDAKGSDYPRAGSSVDGDGAGGVMVPNFGERGNSGTQTYGGYFTDDHLAELQGVQAAEKYELMARSDYQVDMLLDIVKNPILSCILSIEPGDDTEEAKRQADYIKLALFERMGTKNRRREFLTYMDEALSSMEHGYALFEIVHKLDKDVPGFGDMIGIKNIGFRDQRTIQKWNLRPEDESIESVEQYVNNDLVKEGQSALFIIPGKNLMVITRRMKGSNFTGQSILRGIYGNYVRKNAKLKWDMLGLEKTAVGFPYATVPVGSENGTRANYMARILQFIRTHDKMGAVISDKEKLESLDIKYDAEKMLKAIEAEDTRMTKRFLANFMELGMNDKGGAYALGQNLSDVFFKSIGMVADSVIQPINTCVIKPLVEMNFGPQEKYPKLVIKGLQDSATTAFATILTTLKGQGLLQESDELMTFIHDTFRLPKYDREKGMPEPVAPVLPGQDPNDPDAVPPKKGEKKEDDEDKGPKKPKPKDKEKLQDFFGVELLSEVNKTRSLIRSSKKELAAEMQSDMERRTQLMLASIRRGLEAGESRKAIIENRCVVPGAAKFNEMIYDNMASIAVRTSELVASELDMSGIAFADDVTRFLKNASPKTRARLRAQVDMIVETVDADLRKAVVFSFNNNVDSLESVDALMVKIRDASQRYLDGTAIYSAAANAVASNVNGTRNDIFLTPEVFSGIDSFVITNPSPEAAICIAMEGRVISKEDYKQADLPPWHHGCETFLVAQTNSKKNKKPIDPRGMNPDPADVPGKTLEQILASKTL